MLITAYFLRRKSISRKLFISATVTFLIFSNPFLFNEVFKHWEGRNDDLKREKYDAVVVLGGYSSWNSRHKLLGFNDGSDRLIMALELYHTKKADKIVLSGGSGLILKPQEKESILVKEKLLNLGVSTDDIILENESKNTHENAAFTNSILRDRYGEEGHFILITSAFHMRRSKKCFEKNDLNFEYLKVDFQIDDEDYDLATFIVPSAYTLGNWQLLIKEWLGYMMYWLNGYF